jgi:hypothetical protein
MAAFTAAVGTPGLHSHELPPRTVAEGLSRPDASEWVRAMQEEAQSCLRYVWKDCALLAGSRPYQVVLFLSANNVDVSRHAWWWGGNSMGWTLRKHLLPCALT